MSADASWLSRAVELATENVAAGGGPFGALIVGADGAVLAEGRNRVTRDLDPTAHAEVVAIRRACQALGAFSLEGATLYTSCEPCPMCLASVLWSRLERVVFAADRHDAQAAGFDDRAFYALFERHHAEWTRPRVEALRIEQATEPFTAWIAHGERTAY